MAVTWDIDLRVVVEKKDRDESQRKLMDWCLEHDCAGP
jgi:hypothetical protein